MKALKLLTLFSILTLAGCAEKPKVEKPKVEKPKVEKPKVEKPKAGKPGTDPSDKGDANDKKGGDPQVLARKILELWQKKDLLGLMKLTPVKLTAKQFEDLKPGGRAYEKLTSEKAWRWRAVRDWDGQLRTVRSRKMLGVILAERGGSKSEKRDFDPDGRPTSADKGDLEVRKSLVCLQLVLEDDGWKFDGVFQPDPDFFEKWGALDEQFAKDVNSKVTDFDANNPAKVFQAFITAVKQKDLNRVLKLTSPTYLKNLPQEQRSEPEPDKPGESPSEEKQPTIEEQLRKIVDGYANSYEQIRHWDGRVRQVRLKHEVRVKFGESPDSAFVVELKFINGKWVFEDILSPPKSAFDEWGRIVETED